VLKLRSEVASNNIDGPAAALAVCIKELHWTLVLPDHLPATAEEQAQCFQLQRPGLPNVPFLTGSKHAYLRNVRDGIRSAQLNKAAARRKDMQGLEKGLDYYGARLAKKCCPQVCSAWQRQS
jgi:hypothetical protein